MGVVILGTTTKASRSKACTWAIVLTVHARALRLILWSHGDRLRWGT